MSEEKSLQDRKLEELLMMKGYQLKDFQVEVPEDLFPNATNYPQFFNENLVNPNRVIKQFINNPQGNIRIFYYQLLRVSFEIWGENGVNKSFLQNLKKIILLPEFEILFTPQTQNQRDIFNDFQFKRFFAQILYFLENQESPNIQEILNNFPIIDTVFIHIIRSILANHGINQDFNTKISTQTLMGLSQILNLNVSIFNNCWKFQDSDMFLYEENEDEIYLTYVHEDTILSQNKQANDEHQTSQENYHQQQEYNYETNLSQYNNTNNQNTQRINKLSNDQINNISPQKPQPRQSTMTETYEFVDFTNTTTIYKHKVPKQNKLEPIVHLNKQNSIQHQHPQNNLKLEVADYLSIEKVQPNNNLLSSNDYVISHNFISNDYLKDSTDYIPTQNLVSSTGYLPKNNYDYVSQDYNKPSGLDYTPSEDYQQYNINSSINNHDYSSPKFQFLNSQYTLPKNEYLSSQYTPNNFEPNKFNEQIYQSKVKEITPIYNLNRSEFEEYKSSEINLKNQYNYEWKREEPLYQSYKTNYEPQIYAPLSSITEKPIYNSQQSNLYTSKQAYLNDTKFETKVEQIYKPQSKFSQLKNVDYKYEFEPKSYLLNEVKAAEIKNIPQKKPYSFEYQTEVKTAKFNSNLKSSQFISKVPDVITTISIPISASSTSELGDFYRDFTNSFVLEKVNQPHKSNVRSIKNNFRGVKRSGIMPNNFSSSGNATNFEINPSAFTIKPNKKKEYEIEGLVANTNINFSKNTELKTDYSDYGKSDYY